MKKTIIFTLCLILMLSLLPMAAAEEPAAPVWDAEAGLEYARAHLICMGGFPKPTGREAGGKLLTGPETARLRELVYNGLINRDEVIDLSELNLDWDAEIQNVSNIIYNVVNNNPEIFYCRGMQNWEHWLDDSGVWRIKSVTPYYAPEYTGEHVDAMNAVIDDILSRLDPEWTDEQKLLFLHDYLVLHCYYDQTFSRYNAYNALVEGTAVCQGYAEAYCILARRAGIASEVVSSNIIDHAWNLVRLGGADYYVDCTWDDPIGPRDYFCGHGNFLLSRDGIHSNHVSEDWLDMDGNSIYDSTPGSTRYDNWFWRGSNTQVPIVGSTYAYALSSDKGHVYLRSATTGAVSTVTLANPPTWYVWGNPNSYWTDSFLSLTAKNGSFWFSTPTEIWSLSTAGAVQLRYTLSGSEQTVGYIYGLTSDEGGLWYHLYRSPNRENGESASVYRLQMPGLFLTGQPADVTVTEGDEAVFRVSANAVSYQWQSCYDGSSWADCTAEGSQTDTLRFTASLADNGLKLRCVVRGCGEVRVSKTAALTVTPDTERPDAPTGLAAGNNQTTGRVKLSWQAVNKATGYNVYRAASENGTYTRLNDAPLAALTYTDGKSGNAGNTYWYRVTAVKGDRESERSAAVSGVSMCQRPVNLKAVADDQAGTVTLSWDAPAIKGSVSGYRIYKWNANKNAFEWLGGSLKAAGTATSFIVPAQYVTRGVSTQYSIRGFNTKNTLGSISIYAVPAAAAVKTLPETPAGLAAANNLTTGRVKLSWQSVQGAEGYNVYRASSENGAWEKLNSAPVTAASYTDGRSGNAGTTYWYKVTALSGGLESEKCAAVSRVSMCQRPDGLQAQAGSDGSVRLSWNAPAIKGSVSGYRVYLWDSAKGGFQWIGGNLKAAGTAVSVTVPASALADYKGRSVQFSIRGFNTKNILGSLSIYAVPAAVTVK